LSTIIINPEKFDAKPIAIFFDLDNTLYPYRAAHEAGTAAVLAKATKIGIGSEEFDAAFTRARTDIKSQLGHTASSHSRLLYFQRTLEYLGLRSQSLLSLEFEQTYWGGYLAATELREGVLDFLDQLSRFDIRRVLVTDLTTQIQFRKLVYLELDQRFEFIVTSEESGEDKPHPAGFELAVDKLGLPEEPDGSRYRNGEIWMIGDSLGSDIVGAKRAINATTLALTGEIGDPAGNRSIDMVFDSFRDLERFVVAKDWRRDK